MRHITCGAILLSLLVVAAVSFADSGFSKGGNPKQPFRFYDGPARARQEVAVLKSPNFALRRNKFPYQVTIFLYEINGKPGWSRESGYNSLMSRGFYIELPPGPYTLTVGYRHSTMLSTERSASNQTVAFTAEAGHEYVLNAKTSSGKWPPKVGETWYTTLDDETAGTSVHP